jgi:hypothetical protein
LQTTWRYSDILLELQANLVHKGQRYAIPMYGGESLDHAMFKVSIAAHLLTWGYRWEQIHWEETPIQSATEFRPDLYVEGERYLPSFWFECLSTQQEKLCAVIAALPDFRVVRVVDCNWFVHFWNGDDGYLINPEHLNPEQLEDRKVRKKVVLQQREMTIPPGAECWAVRGREGSPRIIYAVRRELDGSVTYLDTGEGWSLSSFRYISKRRDGFQPIMPGIAGSEAWKGESQFRTSNEIQQH